MGYQENLGEGGGQTFKGSDQEKSTLAASNIRLLIFFGEEDQQVKLAQLVRKKFMITEEKLGKMTTFSPFLSPNFIQGSTVIAIPNNVELCKQYFLQEYVLLIRKLCN